MRPPKKRQSAVRTPLNRILGTEANVRLLRVLTSEPNSLSRSELGRRAGLEGKGAHLAARRLEEVGIVRRVGTGLRQQVKLELNHPLAAPLQTLFREEQARVERLLESLKQAAQNLAPELDSAWIQGDFAEHLDRPGAPIVMGVLARGATLPRITKALRMAVAPTEAREDVTVEIIGFTRPDIEVAKPDQKKELARAMTLFGIPPSAFTQERTEGRPLRKSITHSDRDREQTLIASEVASRLARNPGKRQAAQQWIRKRLESASEHERGDLEEWLSILDSMSPPRLARFLVDQGERATRLRQTFPFLDVLSADERQEIVRKARSE